MPIAVSAAQALANRRGNTFKEVIAQPFYRRLYIGSEPQGGGTVEEHKLSMPQAYLVEQPANSTVAPHFHDTNQFQVFVHGKGVFGKRAITGLMVHYAGAHTPYGPIFSAEEGVHYFTLRNNWDSGAKIMPANRHKLRKVKRIHRMAEDVPVPQTKSLMEIVVETTNLIGGEDDGLGAQRIDLGPGHYSALTMDRSGAGAYALVLAGSVNHAQTRYESHSLFYRRADEAEIGVTAGIDGASILLLQFPPEPFHHG